MTNDDASWEITADTILLATGARSRVLADAAPDGERILSWEQIYQLDELPEHLIVVGSGVTGTEFASAFHALGSTVTLVSSRDRVLPGEDVDAAGVLEDVFTRRGLNVRSRSRAVAARRVDNSVIVTLDDSSTLQGSHVLMAVGSLPNTDDLGLKRLAFRPTLDSSPSIVCHEQVHVTSMPQETARGEHAGVRRCHAGKNCVYHALVTRSLRWSPPRSPARSSPHRKSQRSAYNKQI